MDNQEDKDIEFSFKAIDSGLGFHNLKKSSGSGEHPSGKSSRFLNHPFRQNHSNSSKKKSIESTETLKDQQVRLKRDLDSKYSVLSRKELNINSSNVGTASENYGEENVIDAKTSSRILSLFIDFILCFSFFLFVYSLSAYFSGSLTSVNQLRNLILSDTLRIQILADLSFGVPTDIPLAVFPLIFFMSSYFILSYSLFGKSIGQSLLKLRVLESHKVHSFAQVFENPEISSQSVPKISLLRAIGRVLISSAMIGTLGLGWILKFQDYLTRTKIIQEI